jgi:hypothetical protein
MVFELELKMYLYQYCVNKVTLHLGYLVSLWVIVINALRVPKFEEMLKDKRISRYMLIACVLILSSWIVGRLLFWQVMMDGVNQVDMSLKINGVNYLDTSGEMNSYAISGMIHGAKNYVNSIVINKKTSFPKLIAHFSINSYLWLAYSMFFFGIATFLAYLFDRFTYKRINDNE